MKITPYLIALKFEDGTIRISDKFSGIDVAISNSKNCIDIFRFYLESPVFTSWYEAREHCKNVYSQEIAYAGYAKETWLSVVQSVAKDKSPCDVGVCDMRILALQLERLMT